MKHLNYIFVFILSFFFFSCEKDEFSANSNTKENEEYYINPEDTAGIIVPEGFSMVYFSGNKSMTRANVETRVQHLRYIIYQSDTQNGTYKLAYNVVVPQSQLSSWPVKGIIYFVPKNKYYKVAFLGNIDKSVFSSDQNEDVLLGVGNNNNFEDARIILPRVEFSDNNMYYFTSVSFDSFDKSGKGIVYAPITLQRIVSRNDITKEGLTADYIGEATNNDTYLTAYWRQIIKTKLKGSIFTEENSSFRYQMGEALKNNLIYPLVYTGLANASDADRLTSSYPVVQHYLNEWNISNAPSTFPDVVNGLRTIYPEFMASGNNYGNNFCIHYAQYLYDTFVADNSIDPQALTNGLNSIYTKDIFYNDPQVIDPNGSVTRAINKIIALFKANYTSGELYPWRNMRDNHAIVEINTIVPMPGGIDFNKQIDNNYNKSGRVYYSLKDNGYSTDKYISLVSLGNESTNTNKLSVSKIYTSSELGTTIDYIPTSFTEIVSNGFEAGTFHRNIKTVTTQQVQSINLINPKNLMVGKAYQQKIEVNYYDVFQAMNPQSDNANHRLTLGNTAKAQFVIENLPDNPDAKVARIQSYIINALNDSKYDLTKFTDDSNLSFPFVDFTCPVISAEGLNITTKWVSTTLE